MGNNRKNRRRQVDDPKTAATTTSTTHHTTQPTDTTPSSTTPSPQVSQPPQQAATQSPIAPPVQTPIAAPATLATEGERTHVGATDISALLAQTAAAQVKGRSSENRGSGSRSGAVAGSAGSGAASTAPQGQAASQATTAPAGYQASGYTTIPPPARSAPTPPPVTTIPHVGSPQSVQSVQSATSSAVVATPATLKPGLSLAEEERVGLLNKYRREPGGDLGQTQVQAQVQKPVRPEGAMQSYTEAEYMEYVHGERANAMDKITGDLNEMREMGQQAQRMVHGDEPQIDKYETNVTLAKTRVQSAMDELNKARKREMKSHKRTLWMLSFVCVVLGLGGFVLWMILRKH